MEIQRGEVYRRSPEHGSEWFVTVLEEANRTHTHPIHISVMTASASVISGVLAGAEAGAVKVQESGEPDVAQIAADDIAAFTLLAEPPPDASEELRG